MSMKEINIKDNQAYGQILIRSTATSSPICEDYYENMQ